MKLQQVVSTQNSMSQPSFSQLTTGVYTIRAEDVVAEVFKKDGLCDSIAQISRIHIREIPTHDEILPGGQFQITVNKLDSDLNDLNPSDSVDPRQFEGDALVEKVKQVVVERYANLVKRSVKWVKENIGIGQNSSVR